MAKNRKQSFLISVLEVENVRIMYHPETKRSRRFGFITFCNESSVKAAMDEGEQHVLDGKVLDVKHAFKRSNEVGGVPPVTRTK